MAWKGTCHDAQRCDYINGQCISRWLHIKLGSLEDFERNLASAPQTEPTTMSQSAPAGPFVIKLQRPGKSGDQYDVHIIIDSEMSGQAGSDADKKEVQNQSLFKGELSGRVTVLDIDSIGNEKTLSILIKQFVAGPDNKSALPAGAVVEVNRVGKHTQCKVQGHGNLNDDAKTDLEEMFPPIDSKAISERPDVRLGNST